MDSRGVSHGHDRSGRACAARLPCRAVQRHQDTPYPSLVAALARILEVPVSYFDGRAVRLSTDAATGRQVVVEELRNSAGQPNPRPAPAL